MFQSRTDKTFDKLRSGKLPAPPAIRTLMDSDKEKTCSGCGETIGQFERFYYARIRKVMVLRFHLICHEAWVRFRAAPEAGSTTFELSRST